MLWSMESHCYNGTYNRYEFQIMMPEDRASLPVEDFNWKRSLKSKVRKKLGGECLYCGCSPRFVTVDHILSESMGGSHEEVNLAPACRPCNQAKGDEPVMQWWIRQEFYKSYRVNYLRQIQDGMI